MLHKHVTESYYPIFLYSKLNPFHRDEKEEPLHDLKQSTSYSASLNAKWRKAIMYFLVWSDHLNQQHSLMKNQIIHAKQRIKGTGLFKILLIKPVLLHSDKTRSTFHNPWISFSFKHGTDAEELAPKNIFSKNIFSIY